MGSPVNGKRVGSQAYNIAGPPAQTAVLWDLAESVPPQDMAQAEPLAQATLPPPPTTCDTQVSLLP